MSPDGKFFRTMTLAQFNTCRTIGEFHLCDRGLVVRKSPDKDAIPPVHKDPDLCIFALFQRRFELAIAVCETIIGIQMTAMQMVGPNIFASYAADPHQGTITCKGDTNPSGFTTTTFTVDSAQQRNASLRLRGGDGHTRLCGCQQFILTRRTQIFGGLHVAI
jgi:hypothetical protein